MIKPFPKPSTKRPRLPRRNAVTIIAGFKSYEGVVLCADTQETVEHAKRHVPKLRFEPHKYKSLDSSEVHDSNLAAAFCGAGEGPFIDKLVEEAWKRAEPATSLGDACTEIETSIKQQYRDFGRIYQRGMCPEVQLIFGVKMDGDSKLFTAMGPIVNERQGYDSGGVGHYMADFLARRMYKDYLTLHQCVILAAYILFQSKEHVEGCGGDSQIAVLRENGASGSVNWSRIKAITTLLDSADSEVGTLLLHSANLELEDKNFKETIDLTITLLDTFRSNQRDEIAKWNGVFNIFGGDKKYDYFGLPMPSDDQKSEPDK
jgi:20S proteasome alpha/beta subunit